MSLRIATLLIAATVILGGCAQSHLQEMTADLTALGNLDTPRSAMAADVIYDRPAATNTDPNQPVKAAAWGEALVQPAPEKLIGDTTVGEVPLRGSVDVQAEAASAPPVKVADGWQPDTRRIVSPVPVGPPVAAAPRVAPVVWGPGVVVSAGLTGGPTGNEPYLLDTGDKLRIFVYGQPSLSRVYIVDQVGNIAVPLIGSVHARGRTTVDLEHVIAARLGREFVKDPQVTVDVAQTRPFFILGEVRLPGQYAFVPGMTVEQAVAIGGGYTERASQRSFRITRKLGPLVDQIEAPADYTLCPGDTVYVYERIF